MSNLKQISTGMLMYVQDYDETLPEPGLGGVFRNATNTGLGQFYRGVLPFHLAIQPYIKNYQVFGCPSDDKKQNSSIDRSDMKVMLVAAGVPNASNLPAYSNTPAFHEAVAQISPNSYASNYFLSQVYPYTDRNRNVVPSSDVVGNYSGRGRALTEIDEPASTWMLTEWSTSSDTGAGGWYCYPGYLNANSSVGFRSRWRGGQRHQEGRDWLFVDGHVKWYKDPPFESSPGVATPDSTILNHYTNIKVYTLPT